MIGHIDQTWTTAFTGPSNAVNVAAFRDLLYNLMDGQRVGYAMEGMNTRYAETAAVLAAELQALKSGELSDQSDVAYQWLTHNDAQGYIVLGDPAARLTFPPPELPRS